MLPVIDDEVSGGHLSRAAYQRLAFAEGNGNASPMRWLGARLQHLRATIQSGRAVEVSMPGSVIVIATVADFDRWCAKEFPDASSWFFGKSAATATGGGAEPRSPPAVNRFTDRRRRERPN